MTALIPELLKALPWVIALLSGVFAYVRHTQASAKEAKAEEKIASAAATVSAIQQSNAESNQKVSDVSLAAVQTTDTVAAAVKATTDSDVQKELLNEFGRKD